MKPTINEMFAASILATNDPTAPLKLQALHTGIESVAKMLVNKASQAKTKELTERLLKDFSDTELDKVNMTPEFIISLLSMLKSSIESWVCEQTRISRHEPVSVL